MCLCYRWCFASVHTDAPVCLSSAIIHNIHDDLTVNKIVNRGSKINRRRKWRAVHPVVAVDACFERSSVVTYKTVCVVLRDSDFTLVKDNYTLLYTSARHLCV